jgi:hypothetical protein
MLLNCFAENPCIYRFALVKPTMQSSLKPMADCFSAQTIRRRFLTRMKLVLILLVAGIVPASSIFCNQIFPCESVSKFFWSTRNFLLHTFRFWRRRWALPCMESSLPAASPRYHHWRDTVAVQGEAAASGSSSSLSPVALAGRLGTGKRRPAGIAVSAEQWPFMAAA